MCGKSLTCLVWLDYIGGYAPNVRGVAPRNYSPCPGRPQAFRTSGGRSRGKGVFTHNLDLLRLNEAGLGFDKTHGLSRLLTQTTTVEPGWAVLQPAAGFLTDFAVLYRYPGQAATKAQAQQAVKYCREVRRVIRAAFGLLNGLTATNLRGRCSNSQIIATRPFSRSFARRRSLLLLKWPVGKARATRRRLSFC